MGTRGSLPARTFLEPEPLRDMEPPDWLGDLGTEFWHRHAPWLVENDLLNTTTADTFALCCDLWQRVRENEGTSSRVFLDTLARFLALSKLFRLAPTEKMGKKTGLQDLDEFEMDMP